MRSRRGQPHWLWPRYAFPRGCAAGRPPELDITTRDKEQLDKWRESRAEEQIASRPKPSTIKPPFEIVVAIPVPLPLCEPVWGMRERSWTGRSALWRKVRGRPTGNLMRQKKCVPWADGRNALSSASFLIGIF